MPPIATVLDTVDTVVTVDVPSIATFCLFALSTTALLSNNLTIRLKRIFASSEANWFWPI
jgi:hypothetical protein